MTDLWVFGYGSLIWRPGFPYLERRVARLIGAHRALCVYSWVHRGTREHPGLVLGLDRGGICRGIAFRVAPEEWDERRRDISASASRSQPSIWNGRGRCGLPTAQRRRRSPIVVDRAHPQYAGKLDEETQFRIVAEADGQSGANRDYVINTAAHLAELGMPDAAA